MPWDLLDLPNRTVWYPLFAYPCWVSLCAGNNQRKESEPSKFILFLGLLFVEEFKNFYRVAQVTLLPLLLFLYARTPPAQVGHIVLSYQRNLWMSTSMSSISKKFLRWRSNYFTSYSIHQIITILSPFSAKLQSTALAREKWPLSFTSAASYLLSNASNSILCRWLQTVATRFQEVSWFHWKFYPTRHENLTVTDRPDKNIVKDIIWISLYHWSLSRVKPVKGIIRWSFRQNASFWDIHVV